MNNLARTTQPSPSREEAILDLLNEEWNALKLGDRTFPEESPRYVGLEGRPETTAHPGVDPRHRAGSREQTTIASPDRKPPRRFIVRKKGSICEGHEVCSKILENRHLQARERQRSEWERKWCLAPESLAFGWDIIHERFPTSRRSSTKYLAAENRVLPPNRPNSRHRRKPMRFHFGRWRRAWYSPRPIDLAKEFHAPSRRIRH